MKNEVNPHTADTNNHDAQQPRWGTSRVPGINIQETHWDGGRRVKVGGFGKTHPRFPTATSSPTNQNTHLSDEEATPATRPSGGFEHQPQHIHPHLYLDAKPKAQPHILPATTDITTHPPTNQPTPPLHPPIHPSTHPPIHPSTHPPIPNQPTPPSPLSLLPPLFFSSLFSQPSSITVSGLILLSLLLLLLLFPLSQHHPLSTLCSLSSLLPVLFLSFFLSSFLSFFLSSLLSVLFPPAG